MRDITIPILLTLLLVALPSGLAAQSTCVILIDEDSIDNSSPVILELAAAGICGGGDPAVCVNEQAPFPGLRAPLPLPIGTILGNGVPGGTVAPLFTGQTDDFGWFELTQIPQSWIDAGPTTDGLTNYLWAAADGFGINGEFLLDEIPGVNPLDADELASLVGTTCCAVVYDSDVGILNDGFGNLQGATLGVLNLTVLAIGPDPAGSVLPDITIQVEDPTDCQMVPLAVDPSTWGSVKARFK